MGRISLMGACGLGRRIRSLGEFFLLVFEGVRGRGGAGGESLRENDRMTDCVCDE
jgi:hypothetical protein